MLDFDASKLLIIGVVALVVIGPKDLPRVLRQVGQMVGKLRRMAGDFQGQFMEAMKEADLQDLRDEVSKLKGSATLDVAFNPVHDIRTEITRAVGTGTATSAAVDSGSSSGMAVPLAPVPESLETPQVSVPVGSLPAPVLADAEAEISLGAAALIDVPKHLALEPEDHASLAAAGIGPVSQMMGGAVDVNSGRADHSVTTVRRRTIRVPKRRGPGDRMASLARSPAIQTRLILPPRRDPRP